MTIDPESTNKKAPKF